MAIFWQRKRGIVVREAELQGSTALHLCALCGHPDLTELLCKRGADASRKNKQGTRPLHLVAQCSSSNCVCISNKVPLVTTAPSASFFGDSESCRIPLLQLWSFGCRTVRTKRILRWSAARQCSSLFRFLFPTLFDCFFGDSHLSSRRNIEVSSPEPSFLDI